MSPAEAVTHVAPDAEPFGEGAAYPALRRTAGGRERLTKSQRQIIEYLRWHRDEPCSKAQIARGIGRCTKTVDRLLSAMRRDGLVVSEARYAESGAQLPNLYRLVER